MITQEELKEWLYYDPDTGVFVWRKFHQPNKKEGSKAGTVNRDHIWIGVQGKRYAAARLAWLYVYGEWPKGSIDHINHDGTDNSISNLRDCNHKVNMKNQPLRSNNKSGFNGVSWNKSKQKWEASIKVDSKNKFLGRYHKLSDAIEARKEADIKYGYHSNHGKN